MPAEAERFGTIPSQDRVRAAIAVALVQLAIGLALISGLRVPATAAREAVERLVEVTLPRVPPPVPPAPAKRAAARPPAPAPAAPVRAAVGGPPAPKPAPQTPAPRPVVAIQPSAPAGGGSVVGVATGTGQGGGSGGEGTGGSGGGETDLVQIAGAIESSDYPKDLRERGIGGRVEVLFTVGANGRVTGCSVTRSSGVPELDSLTCRLIQQRFRYRPSTDSRGRPIADEVEGEQDWVANGRY